MAHASPSTRATTEAVVMSVFLAETAYTGSSKQIRLNRRNLVVPRFQAPLSSLP